MGLAGSLLLLALRRRLLRFRFCAVIRRSSCWCPALEHKEDCKIYTEPYRGQLRYKGKTITPALCAHSFSSKAGVLREPCTCT